MANYPSMLILTDNSRDETNRNITTMLKCILEVEKGEAMTVTITKGRIEATNG